MKKIILAISVLLVAGALHFSFGQALNINLKAEKDCNTKIFSATIQLYIDTGSNLKIGNSSILLSFNDDALIFNSYQALHFNGSDQCAGIGISAWDVHKFDDVSYPDQFHLALSLADTNFSCPVISYPDTIDVGIIYFDIVQQGANPFVYIDTGATWFNSDIPNNGSGMLTTGNIASIDTAGILLCDCPGMGEPCDDNNVLTVDDKYDNYCNCFGEYLDSDQDGILDGIDPCTDIIYEAEEADMASVEIWNNYYQFTGSGFINYLHSTGDSVWFTILPADTGTYTLGFRYSLGYGSRPLKLTIDGTEIVSSFDFPSTGSWSAWDTIVYSYYFQPGYHTVLLTTIGYEGPMLDHLKLSICTGCQTSGIVCDDSDPCTTNDLIDANCNCEGIYLDTDNDGVCNTFDICEGGDDFLDTDLDGIPDFCDACDNNLIGTSCNDGNPCTSNDTLNAACICEGVFNGPDTDGDGVCDAFDLCPGGDDNFDFDLDGIPDFCDTCNNLLLGLPCDDGNPCTILDVYDTTCICVGVYVDTDNDGVCDMLDQCEGFADSLDIDADGIPDACDNCNNLFIGLTCDDGDTCTYNDVITADCECVGEYFDTDYDGVCDIFDLCLGFADSIDNDGDAIPNACDNCYDLVYQAEDMYYSSSAIPGIGANATGSGYVRFTNNIDTIIFNVMAVDTGMVSISIRYAQADTGKTGLIEVDGQTLFENFAYPKVYDEWDVWDRVQFNIYFSEGPHTIKLINNDQDPYGPRIDYLSLCNPNYVPEPVIAKGNNQFEQNFDNWVRLYNWGTGVSNISIDSSFAFCGYKDAYIGNAGGYQQLITTIDNLLIGDTVCLHFYAAGGMANAWVGPSSSSVFEGTYHFVNVMWAQGAYVHDSIEFVATEPSMIIWFDIFPNTELYLDNFSFDGYGCEPGPELYVTGISCYGETDASITVNCTGGAYPLSYLWNTGDTVETILNLGAGQYTVSATDKNGISNSISYDIVEPGEIYLISTISHETTVGAGDGEINVSVFGGISPYTYLWSTGDTVKNLLNVSGGFYTLSISDSHACLLDSTFEVSTVSLLPTPGWSYQITAVSHIFLFQPTAQLEIDGVPLTTGDYVGAFYDSLGTYACAGYMMWLNSVNSVTVFGDDAFTSWPDGFPDGDAINWKVWRSSDSVLLNASATYVTNAPNIPDSGYFAPNGLSEIASMSCACSTQTQSIVLQQGWDMYSSYLDIINPEISLVFDSILNNLILIKNTYGNVYWPAFNYNGIGDMITGQGYHINMLQTDTLYISGNTIDPLQTTLSLPSGWSLVGYLHTTPANIVLMLTPIVSDLVIAKDGSGNVYWPLFNINTIGNMIPGKGYQLKLSASVSFSYPAITTANSKTLLNRIEPVHFQKLKSGSNNMTLGIPINTWQHKPKTGDEIGVFSQSGLLVGSSVFSGGNLAIAIWGDDIYSENIAGLQKGEKFILKIWHRDNGKEEIIDIENWSEGDDIYTADKIAIVGELFYSSVTGENIVLYQNMPNPFTNQTEFSFYLPAPTRVEFSILNLLGEKIDLVFSGTKEAGLHRIKYQTKNLSAGSYYYHLKTTGFSSTKKMVVLKGGNK